MATTVLTAMGSQSPSTAPETLKFPAFQPDYLPVHQEEEDISQVFSRTASPARAGAVPNGSAHTEQWHPRKDTNGGWANGRTVYGGSRHGRQKSLSEAIRTIRTRHGSVSASAHEIADALKAPVSPKLIVGHGTALRGIGQ